MTTQPDADEVIDLLCAGKPEAAMILAKAIEDRASRETLILACKGYLRASERSGPPLDLKSLKKIVLFSMGEYSDYSTFGLLRVDGDEYQQAVDEYEKLEQEEKETLEEIKRRTEAGDITRNESQALQEKIKDHPTKRWEIWERLRKTGTPVAHDEFWHG